MRPACVNWDIQNLSMTILYEQSNSVFIGYNINFLDINNMGYHQYMNSGPLINGYFLFMITAKRQNDGEDKVGPPNKRAKHTPAQEGKICLLHNHALS